MEPDDSQHADGPYSSGQVKCNSELTGMSGNSFTVVSFPGLPTIQFYSMQKRR